MTYKEAKNILAIRYVTLEEVTEYLKEGSLLSGIPIEQMAFPIVQSVPIDQRSGEDNDFTGDTTDSN